MPVGFNYNPAISGLQRQTYGGYPPGAPDLSRGGLQPGLTPPPISQWPVPPQLPPGSRTAEPGPTATGKYGLPPYTGTTPLTQNVPAETQYEAASRLAGGEQANQAARELQRQRDEATLQRQREEAGTTSSLYAQEAKNRLIQQEAEAKNRAGLSAQESGQTIAQTQAKAEEEFRAAEAARTGTSALSSQQAKQASSLSAQEALQQLAATKSGAGLQAEAEQRRTGLLPEIISSLTGRAPVVEYGAGLNLPGGGGYEAARQAAFARAKDQTGQIGRAALDALRGQLASANLLGSGREAQGILDITSGAQGQLGEVTREQQIQDLQNLQNLADKTYAGRITQRGQTLGLAPSLAGLITSRAVY